MDYSYFGSVNIIDDGNTYITASPHYGIDVGYSINNYVTTACDYGHVDERINKLEEQLRITENYLELIREIAFDKRHRFTDEMMTIQKLASLGMMCDKTETIRYDKAGNGYNILNEKTKDGENNG